MGLARRIRWNWRARIHLVDFLAADLSEAGGSSARFESGARLHPQRSPAGAGQNKMVSSVSTAANLGIHYREITDRSSLVVLSFLGSRFFAKQTWNRFNGFGAAHRGDLFDLRRWQRRRRLDIFFFDQAWE